MRNKIAKILFGVLLLPLCIGFTWQLAATVVTIQYKAGLPYYFIAGCLTYFVFHVLFKKPILTYVVGHELTHALFAVLFGGSVKSFQASDRGGRVTISKSNFIITLAPYFFPVYTFFALVCYWIARISEANAVTINVLVFISGATFMFHVILTFIFLQEDQSDIREHGQIFSYPLIYLFNTIFTAFILYIYLAENMDYLLFMAGGIMKSIGMLVAGIKNLYAIISSGG